MNTRVVHKSPAIVLHGLDYGESDRIVTFYTHDFGKLKGIAKGARRSRKRFSNALEPFSYGNIIFSKKGRGTLALIEGIDIINHHAKIREDLGNTLMSSYLIELIDKFTLEGKKNASNAFCRKIWDMFERVQEQVMKEVLLNKLRDANEELARAREEIARLKK